MNVTILHLSAVFQKQEMATQKLQEEIAAKEKIAARCNVSIAGCVKQIGYNPKQFEDGKALVTND